VTVSPFQVGQRRGVKVGIRFRQTGIAATGQPFEIHGDFEQANQTAEVDQLMGAPLLMAPDGFPSEVEP
jgi:hypothetical protein